MFSLPTPPRPRLVPYFCAPTHPPAVDQAVFTFLNQQLAHPILDQVLPVYRDKLTWVPLYVIWMVVLLRRYGWRRTGLLLVLTALVIAVADQLAASLLKPWVASLRPCARGLAEVRSLVACGGAYGFPSNHATNHVAVAVVFSLTWVHGWLARTLLFLWATTIALAQVYVGKHYPSDILAGALLGTAVALLGIMIYRRWAGPLRIN